MLDSERNKAASQARITKPAQLARIEFIAASFLRGPCPESFLGFGRWGNLFLRGAMIWVPVLCVALRAAWAKIEDMESHEPELAPLNHRLLPCPFCGFSTPWFRAFGKNSDSQTVECQDCFAATGPWDTREQAIADWNKRSDGPAFAALKARIALLEQALEYYEHFGDGPSPTGSWPPKWRVGSLVETGAVPPKAFDGPVFSPCPFCESAFSAFSGAAGGVRIECCSCGASGPIPRNGDGYARSNDDGMDPSVEQDAIAAWNQRGRKEQPA